MLPTHTDAVNSKKTVTRSFYRGIFFIIWSCQILLQFAAFLSGAQGWDVHILPAAQQLQNRKSEENIAIICSVSGFREDEDVGVDIQWYREEDEKPIARLERLAVSHVKPLSARLLFIRPKIEDSGLYKCIAKVNGNDQIKNKSTRISFIRAAEFIDVDLEQHPEEGDDAQIVCRVRGDPSMEIFWQFEGKTILEGGPRNYGFKDGNQILVIPKFNSEFDDGQYACSVAQFYSFETVVINVTAYARPKITILDGSETRHGYEGRDFTIRCQAVGKPKPHYHWTKYTDGDEKDIAPSEKYDLNDGTLIIRGLVFADQGTYSCFARNALDEAKLDYNLTVFRKPRLKSLKNLTLTRGDTAELICEFSGDGNPKAKWLHLGQQWPSGQTSSVEGKAKPILNIVSTTNSNNFNDGIINGEDSRITVREDDGIVVLTLTAIDEDDAGQYQCVAENEAGSDQKSIFLSIIHAARIVDHSGTQRTIRGNTTEIRCVASAVPEPVWTWIGPSGIIFADGSKYVLDTRTISTTLIVRDIGEDDFGKYTCTADNGIGPPDHADLQLIEILSPATPTDLNCHEHSYPNFGVCRIGDMQHITPGRLPTNITFYIVPEDKTDNTIRQKDTTNVTFHFDNKRTFKLHNLEPRSRYNVRAQTFNEAGFSELSVPDYIETTSAWTPEAPTNIRFECSKICEMDWNEPNDRGSPIKAYRLILREVTQTEPRDYGAESYELDLNADDLKVDLSFLKPLTAYEVRLIAVNDVGNSNAYSVMLNTSDYVDGGRQKNGSTWESLYFMIVLLILVGLIVGVICCVKHHRGFLASVCLICFNTGAGIHSGKSKNVLQSDKVENNSLLSDERNDPPVLLSNEEKCSNGPHSTPV